MTVDFVYSIILTAASKNQGGYINPGLFNLVINQAQLSYMDWLLGYPEGNRDGTKPRLQYGMSENVRNIVTPFIGVPAPLVVNANGQANYPSDYQQTDAMFTTSMDRIRFVQQDSLYSYLQSTIDPVATNPIYLIQNIGFQFYPLTIGNALLSYVKTPPQIFWAYTPDADGRPQFNAGSSSDPIWYDTDMLEVIARALKLVGVNLQAPMITQYANDIQKNGQ